MKNSRLYILIGLVTIIVTLTIWLLWPSEIQKTPPTQKKLEAEFLSMDSGWVDSIVNNLSLDQKLRSLVVQRVAFSSDTGMVRDVYKNGFAGLFFDNPTPELLAFSDTVLKSQNPIPYLRGLSYGAFLPGLKDSLRSNVVFSNNKASLANYSVKLDEYRKYYGINLVLWSLPKYESIDTIHYLKDLRSQLTKCGPETIDSLLSDSILFCLDLSKIPGDSLIMDSIAILTESIVHKGLPAISYVAKNNYFSVSAEFNGLKLLSVDLSSGPQSLVGNDFYLTYDAEKTVELLKSAVSKGYIKQNEIDRSVKRVLMARKWSGKLSKQYHSKRTNDYFNVLQSQCAAELQKGAIVLATNRDRIIPLSLQPDRVYLVRVGKKIPNLHKALSNYTSVYSAGINSVHESEKLSFTTIAKYNPVVVALNGVDLSEDTVFLSNLHQLDKQTNLIIVNGGSPSNLNYLNEFETILHLPVSNAVQWQIAGQIIFGGAPAKGELCCSVSSKFPVGTGKTSNQTRLGYASPSDLGMSAAVLSEISWIVNEGINNRAFPGCQILAVKNGNVVYHKSFGHLKYDRKVPISNDHIYDLASITKIAATTITAMMLYDRGKYKLNDSLYRYLPDTLRRHIYNGRSTLRYLTWRNVMIHKSGLPQGFPYIAYVDYTDSVYGRFDKYYCDSEDDTCYYVPVSENFFMDRVYQDSIWYRINELTLNPNPHYMYSDVNFILLYKLFKGMLEMDQELVKKPARTRWREYNAFETFLNEQVYRPLMMKNTTFLPSRYFPLNQIAPTEDDKFWRKQLVHGYVHDPTAALLGGISGNAGLFSNAHDMAVLFQMLLNKGYYGGKHFINQKTVNLFISRQADSHRGLGFNKPVGNGMNGIPGEVSIESFGHTGFTGNCIWADPVNDIIFIFLSNRSHPDAHNPKIIQLGIWKRIHKIIYNSRPNKEWLKQVIFRDTTSILEVS